MINFLIKLSESEKRILIVLGILLILFFVIIGYLGLLVEKIMKKQGERGEKLIVNVLKARVITSEKECLKFARKKNNRKFAKQAIIPMIMVLVILIVYLIYGAINNKWVIDLFDYQKGEGIGTILFLWDFNDPDCYTTVFGMRILAKWPPLINTPHLSPQAWASYIIVPLMFISGIWYMVITQAHIARTFHLRKVIKKHFSPKIEELDQTPSIEKDVVPTTEQQAINNNEQNNTNQ